MPKPLFRILAAVLSFPLAVVAPATAAANYPITAVTPVAKPMASHIASNGWVLSGIVRDARYQPAAGFTVFLVDSQGVYQAAFGSSKTDSTGHFLINYPGTTTPPNSATPGAQLFISITNTKNQTVYHGSTPFTPVAGSTTYQTILLPA